MKASYHWLRSLVPEIDASPTELAERLTRAGLEVEEIIEYGSASRHVRVAEVTKVEKHPKRDRLKLVTVTTGSAEQTVVCGAPNVPDPGGKVVLAPLGTYIPGKDFTIEARPIGGIESEGMLCSEVELGLTGTVTEGDGIAILDADATVGKALSEQIPATHDWIFDIGITPNRPDALGHIGIAREIAALYGVPFSPPEPEAPARVSEGAGINERTSVTIDDTERCPHYGAAMVAGVKVAPSPAWLRYRLESLGVRSISNVVDITNLVMLEYGHPMHAFDHAKLGGGVIGVRRAKDGEAFTTLDEVERKLVEDDLVITDEDKPVAIAGVMGGSVSGVADGTETVLLECAYFAPRGVRRTARRHGLHTDASYRFERGVDPQAVPDALAHAASLVTQLCGGDAVPGVIIAGVDPAPKVSIELRGARMRSLLGMDVPMDDASAILERLGCEVTRSEADPDRLTVRAPSARPDLTIEADLIEEVMRVHGIDAVPVKHRALVPEGGRSKLTLAERTRRVAIDLGLSEALTFAFVSREELEAVKAPAPSVVLQNPLSEDRSVMRTSLLPGLLDALRRARRHGVHDVSLFCVASRFWPPTGAEAALPDEHMAFAAVIAGERADGLDKPRPVDVYDAKGLGVELVERLTHRAATVARGSAAHLHPRGAAELRVGEAVVGTFGPLHPDVIDALDLDGSAQVVEIDLRALGAVAADKPHFRAIPALPPVTRDLAFVVADAHAAGAIGDAIAEHAGELCESVKLFDLYAGKGVPEGHRSLAYHLVFRDPKASSAPDEARTLTDKEVDARVKAVIGKVGELFGASVRG